MRHLGVPEVKTVISFIHGCKQSRDDGLSNLCEAVYCTWSCKAVRDGAGVTHPVQTRTGWRSAGLAWCWWVCLSHTVPEQKDTPEEYLDTNTHGNQLLSLLLSNSRSSEFSDATFSAIWSSRDVSMLCPTFQRLILSMKRETSLYFCKK